jgi:membrane-associated phospholipid phosphatase
LRWRRATNKLSIYQMFASVQYALPMRGVPRVFILCVMLASLGLSTIAAAAERTAVAQQQLFRDLFRPSPLPVPDLAPARATVADSIATQTQPPPKPEHTGLGALVRDIASDFAAFPRRKSTWVILGIGAGAALLAHPADDYIQEHASGSNAAQNFFKLGKYLGAVYTQAGVAVGLYVIGRVVGPAARDAPKTSKLSHLGFDLMRGLIVSQAFTQGIKYAVQRDRPTGECCSFPSGHASAAFTTASILERHLGYRGAWPTLVGATYVAFSRIADNRHFLSDVVFGSALGIATGWTVVGRHGRESYAFLPVPVRGGIALTFTRVPRTAAETTH